MLGAEKDAESLLVRRIPGVGMKSDDPLVQQEVIVHTSIINAICMGIL
jgi:hypothetical protein